MTSFCKFTQNSGMDKSYENQGLPRINLNEGCIDELSLRNLIHTQSQFGNGNIVKF